MFSYKLAPEFPYPEPINDCYEVAKYVLENPLEFNGNPDQIILAGESAGIDYRDTDIYIRKFIYKFLKVVMLLLLLHKDC